jgi:hypothetical protein
MTASVAVMLIDVIVAIDIFALRLKGFLLFIETNICFFLKKEKKI